MGLAQARTPAFQAPAAPAPARPQRAMHVTMAGTLKAAKKPTRKIPLEML